MLAVAAASISIIFYVYVCQSGIFQNNHFMLQKMVVQFMKKHGEFRMMEE